MSVQVLVPPVLEPVNLAETKVFLQLDSDHEDALILNLIQAATEAIERTTGHALMTRTLRQTIHAWPDKGIFILQARPFVQLIQVQRVNTAGDSNNVGTGDYYVDENRARVIALSTFPRFDFTHPTETLQIDFIAGFGSDIASVPASLRMALLLIARDLYEHRGKIGGTLPLRAQALLAPFTEVRL